MKEPHVGGSHKASKPEGIWRESVWAKGGGQDRRYIIYRKLEQINQYS